MKKYNYISNIDTICFLAYFKNYDTNISIRALLKNLKYEKEKVITVVRSNPTYKHLIQLGEMKFELLPSGKRGYAYILKNNGYELNIAEFSSKISNFAPVQVRISSEYLWAYGLMNSYYVIYNLISNIFGIPEKIKLSRVDLSMHISNANFIDNYEKAYKGNYRNSNVNYHNKYINSLTFGSRSSPIYCRIYDKSLEIIEQSKKTWFYDIWEKNNMDIKNVWNVEFELKNEFFRNYNIFSPEELIEHLNTIWQFLTCEWLLKINIDNKRIDRCSTNDLWKIVQNGYSNFNSQELVKRDRQKDSEALAAIPAIAGYLTTYAAKRGITDITSAVYEILQESENYLLTRKNSYLNNEIKKKIPLYHEREVKENE